MSPSHQLASVAAAIALDPLVEADEAAREYAKRSRSERTREAYRLQWRLFCEWCAQHGGLEPLPATSATVKRYISMRAKAGRRPATIGLALVAIGVAHKRAGYESPCRSEAVRETFKGIGNTHGTAPRQKAPLLNTQLRTVVSTLPSTLAGARDRALLCVGFAGAFRRSELAMLEVSDLEFTPDGLAVTVRRSKTNQEGRLDRRGLTYGSASTCPVRTMKRWLELSGITQGYVFRAVSRYDRLGQPLCLDRKGKLLDGPGCGRAVARIVQRAAVALELDPAVYGGHSLRAGLATSAAQAGKPLHSIMKTTGHRSVAMVQKYIRDAELFTGTAAEGLL